MNVLVIGASRGIGLRFVKHYLGAGETVHATARTDHDLVALRALGANAFALDVTDPAAPAALTAIPAQPALDLAILNAGVLIGRSAAPTAPEQYDFDHVMRVNVLGPMRLIGPVAARLRPAGTLAVLSSLMGSIGDRRGTSAWLYRASKAAVNSVLKDASLTFAGRLTCIAFHPGWVRTDMGGAGADISVEESVAGMTSVLARVGPEDNGKFLNYDGSSIAW
jgi:NAD(P)-dependent dehydrogenase (short-subunit alcohol dehydrogenase family)